MQFLKHLYYGNGKGKTTAALGLALRAAGSGMRVHLVQFLKGGETGELAALEKFDNITVSRCDRNYGFSFRMSENDKSEITECHNRIFKEAIKLADNGNIDMIVLDEIVDAWNLDLIDRKLVTDFILQKPKAEIVMTGHESERIFIDAADYVSEIKAVKHPFEKGTGARRGIEY